LHLKPSDCVACDQLESNVPGKLAVLKGKPSKDAYHACTFFIDHASNKVNIPLNLSTGAEEAVQAKRRFERMANEHGFYIRKYHGNNGVFATASFCSSCELLNQAIDFSGVGAKHQNDIAERMIGTITRRALTMLIHAIRLWPDVITEDLWPFALKLAVDIHNSAPTISGLSPDEIFSGHKSTKNRFRDYHPFGCPVFVLEASLQDGHRIAKGKPRSRMGIYLGNLPNQMLPRFL
jgi:transposase InsO family protein